MQNVLSFRAAIQQGHQPNEFPYGSNQVPQGNVLAVLHFKIWAKQLLAINCYFEEHHTGKKFLVTVYCTKVGYCLSDREINFVSCATGQLYALQISINSFGKIQLLNASLFSS